MSTQANLGVWRPMEPICETQCASAGLVPQAVAPFTDMTNTVPRCNWLDLERHEGKARINKCDLDDSVESLRMQLASKLSTGGIPFPSQCLLDLYAHDGEGTQHGHVYPGVVIGNDAAVVGGHQYAKSFDAAVSLSEGGGIAVQQHEGLNIWNPCGLVNGAISMLDAPRACMDTTAHTCRHGGDSEENPLQSIPGVGSEEQLIEKPWTQEMSELIYQGIMGFDGVGFDSQEGEAEIAMRKAGICADGPSGPRKCGQGTEDSIQNIVAIEKVANDCVVVNVTLLVSGFIIGPKGASIREIQKRTGAQIRSFNKRPSLACARILRTFSIQGTEAAQTHAVDIIKAAVTRYKYLAEGPCNGQRVSHVHTIFGIDFFYSPPPKSIVPHAAGLDPLEDCAIRQKQGVPILQDIFKNGLQ